MSLFSKTLLKDKVAFVTGGSSDGINFHIAKSFCEHGAKVALIGRRANALNERVAELTRLGYEAIGLQADVRAEDQLQQAVSSTLTRFGTIDILVCGAAGNFLVASEDMSPNAFKTVWEIDTFGTFLAVRCCLEALKRSRGVILNITATLGYPQTPYQMHAAAAKIAVDAMTRHYGVELASKFGIRTIGIAPGPVDATEGMRRLSGGQQAEAHLHTIPLRRLGTVQDIANAALFLCSDLGSWITGETLVVDGGSNLYRTPLIDDDQYKQFRAMTFKKAKL